MTRLTSLRVRLMGLVALALIPAIAWLLAHGLARHQQDRADLEDQARNMVQLAAHAQERRLEGARQLLVALTSHPAIRSGDRATCVAAVRRLVSDYQGLYTEMGWADPSGLIGCNAQVAGPGLTIADREYFRRAIRTRAFSVGELIKGRITGALVLGMAHPIVDEAGEVTGVVFANIDVWSLSETLATEGSRLGESIALVDRTGTTVAHSTDAPAMVGSTGARGQIRAMAALGEAVVNLPREDGSQRLFAVSTIRDHLGEPIFFVILGLQADRLLAGLDARFRLDLLTILLFGAGMMVAAWVGAELLVRRPIARLVDATEVLASGRLDARAPDVGGAHELRVLSRAFNDMAERLEKRDLHLREGQRLEALGRLAGGIAHDFNNLLTVILGYGHALRDATDHAPKAARELGELRTAAERAAQLTRQLLAFSRQQILQPKPLLLNDIVTQMETMLRRTLGGDVSLETSLDPALGAVRADPAQMEQVILNLVINARDAMPDGGVVRIEARNVARIAANADDDVGGAPPGEYVELAVSDTGVGMDAATRARVFEPFFTTKGTSGTGLGLATVYGIVTQSGGQVECESAPGAGTRFTVRLPRTADVVARRGAVMPERPKGGAERLLLVEDEEAVRQLVSTVLVQQGYAVTTASDGASALACLASGGAFDLLITDVRMPGMSGPVLYEKILEQHPRLPAVFMSGDSLPPARARADAPPQIFLQKPFTPFTLLRAVRALLDGTDTPPA